MTTEVNPIEASPDPDTLSTSPWQYRLKLGIVCAGITLNALFAGGIFTFPLLAPTLAEHLRLTQPQLSSIALAGMMGQYPFAALIGVAIDRFGPPACSIFAGVLFLFGFGMFSREIGHAPPLPDPASPLQFYLLVLCFAVLGLAAVSSYFSSLVCASRNFPRYSGAAAGTSMALFGLSPLVLSLIASTFFTHPITGLDVTRFTAFLAVFVFAIHVLGAFLLRVVPTPEVIRHEERPNERSALIPKPPDLLDLPPGESGSVLSLLGDPKFWILALTALFILGMCEMLISNIGTIVISLPLISQTSSNPSTMTAAQVRIISIANTFSRLGFGLVADFVSPVASHLPSGQIVFPRKHHVSRMVFLCMGCVLLSAAIMWMLFFVQTQNGVWILSLGSGIAYGSFWAILPGIVSAIWGRRNFGRNFGIVSYAPFIGTPIFSALYAFTANAHQRPGSDVCQGASCWQGTMWICEACSLLGFCGASVLWRAWKGRV